MSLHDNSVHARQAFESHASVVAHFPEKLTIESTSICNLTCVMCPHGIGGVDRPKHMPQEIFDKLRGAMGHASGAQLNGIGEPLASPALWHALENDYFDPEASITFNTNMTLLNARRLEKLANSRARLTLNISLDAATSSTYRRIRGYDFDKVLANIRLVRTARGEREYPRIMLNMTLMRENIEEAANFVDLAKELGADSIGLWHMNHTPDADMARYSVDRDGWHFEYSEQGLWNFPALSIRMLRAAVRRAEELAMPLYFDASKNAFFDDEAEPAAAPAQPQPASAEPAGTETVKHCPHAWDSLVVTSDGDVRVCCYSAAIGNLNESGFDEIWNGAAIRALRRDMGNDVVSDLCRNAPCKYVENMKRVEEPPPRREIAAAPAAVDPGPERTSLVRSVQKFLERLSANR
jgi:MoaA/NifB/PqqE/SkfB family radical SAM enzyme